MHFCTFVFSLFFFSNSHSFWISFQDLFTETTADPKYIDITVHNHESMT